jgi:hypothetical protein
VRWAGSFLVRFAEASTCEAVHKKFVDSDAVHRDFGIGDVASLAVGWFRISTLGKPG